MAPMTTALITGANRGIGLALCRAFLGHGVRVIAGCRQPERATDLRTLAGKAPDRLQVLSLDVTSTASVSAAAAAVSAHRQPLDILINNAAVLLEDANAAFAGLDVEHFSDTFAVNVTGVARVTQALLPALLRSSQGRVVNISSGAGSIADRPGHMYYCYGASKAALNHLTVGLADELRPRNVIVAAISPGWVRTDMGGPGAELPAEESAAAIAATVLRLKPEDSGCFLGRSGTREGYVW
ncbi:MAG TPA: hypothetical protein DCY13_23820 [Verrucomicrobiales bacterium]|nr:hypothetical protein [Verrucomicrobiales bacterium]